MSDQQQQTPTVFVNVKSSQVGLKDKGNAEKGIDPRDKNVYTVEGEEAVKLANQILANAKDSKPTRLDFRTGIATAKASGRKFPSTFIMVRTVEPQAQTEYQAGAGAVDPADRAQKIAAQANLGK